MKRIGIDSAEKFGDDVRKALEQEFYVDNLLTSVATDAEAVSLLSRTDAACEEAGFNLCKVLSLNQSLRIKEQPLFNSIILAKCCP